MASAFTLIEDTVLGSAAASITFNTGLTNYTKFRLTLYVIKDGSGGSIQLRFNGDSGTNYARQSLLASATLVQGARATGQTSISNQNAQTASAAGLHLFEISKPLTTTPARVIYPCSYIAGGSVVLDEVVGEWNNTADAISSISVLSSSGNFAANTRCTLEGAA